ncbi:hypothetical protein [Pediococcus pentosaceus]|uniref:hypothetical protein n=2 Tax=Pediococcus pentosaceus TaxID=1255 RepID=UPI003D802645
MPQETMKRALRIFISSAMENGNNFERERILDLRFKLKNRLDEYKIFEPWILEESNTSSIELEDLYKSELIGSELVIVLLDSRYSIPEGVQKEIITARNNNVKRMYFILPGNNNEEQHLKQNLLVQGETKFIKELSKSDDYVKEIEDIILRELVNVFRHASLQERKMISSDEDVNSIEDGPNMSLIPELSQFNKTTFNQIGYSKQMFRQLIFHDNSDEKILNPQSALDEGVSQLIDRIVSNKPLNFHWDENMLATVKEINSEPSLSQLFLSVLSQRLKAIRLFFNGKYKDTLEVLKSILKNENLTIFPNWFIQDILIDLRNLFSQIKAQHNESHSINPYQQRLNDFATPFFYPGIDHSLNEVYSWVRQENNHTLTASPTQTRIYGTNINIYSDALLEAIVFAVCNGSIAQIRQLPQNLNIISEMLLQRFKDRLYFRDVIQNKLLMGNSFSKIKPWIRKYSYLLGQFSDRDAQTIVSRVHSYSTGNEKVSVLSTTIRIVGDYLTDEHFCREWKMLFKSINDWIDAPELIVSPAKEILGLLRYCFRIPQDDIINILEKISKNTTRYNDDLIDIIVGAIDHKNATPVQRCRINTIIMTIIAINDSDSFSDKVKNAIRLVISYWPDDTTGLCEQLKNKYYNFFKQDILPYVGLDKSTSNLQTYLNNEIKVMVSQNKKQSGEITYGFATNPAQNILGVLSSKSRVEELTFFSLYEAISETILNPYQQVDVKQSATKLLMWLIVHDQKSQNEIEELFKKVDIANITAISSDFFETTTPTQFIETIKTFISISLSKKDNGQLLLALALTTSQKYLLFFSDFLVEFVPLALQFDSLSSVIPQILQFLITYNSNKSENDLLINISECLLILSEVSNYSQMALGQLQKMVSDTNEVVKRNIVSQIKKLDCDTNNQLHVIKEQLISSSSFAVRDLAKRVLE